MVIWYYLDDERDVPAGMSAVLVRNPLDLIEYLDTLGETIHNGSKLVDDLFVSFDHDLGCDISEYDVAKHIVEYKIPISGFRIHSMNPVGADNIRRLLTYYGYKEVKYV